MKKKIKILLTIGKTADKKFLLPYLIRLGKTKHVRLYATKKTHLYLKKYKIKNIFVYKISDIGQKPNIFDLIADNTFDLIINTPTQDKLFASSEFTDGKLIRRGAVKMGIRLITDPEAATTTINNLVEKDA